MRWLSSPSRRDVAPGPGGHWRSITLLVVRLLRPFETSYDTLTSKRHSHQTPNAQSLPTVRRNNVSPSLGIMRAHMTMITDEEPGNETGQGTRSYHGGDKRLSKHAGPRLWRRSPGSVPKELGKNSDRTSNFVVNSLNVRVGAIDAAHIVASCHCSRLEQRGPTR